MCAMVTRRLLRLARGLDRFERVSDETLGSSKRARHVKPAIEAPEVLRSLERFFERGLRKAQRGTEPLELARVDIGHAARG